MLMQAIRDRAQSWIAWVIVALLILVFAVWGVNAYFEPESDVSVGRVNDVDIKLRQFQNAYNQQRARIQGQFGSNIDPALLENLVSKDLVLQSLVEQEVRVQVAEDNGFSIGDAQLASFINQIQEFQTEGRFDRELYEQLVSRLAMSPAQWEFEQRRALLLNQPLLGILNTALVSEKNVNNIVRLRDQERSVGYVIFPLENYLDEITVDDSAVQEHYDRNLEAFANPEQVSIEYIRLAMADLAAKVDVDEDALLASYEEQAENFGTEERRKASHILIQVDSDADEAGLEEARKKAEEVLAKAREGEAFEELAKTYSDDPGSAGQGGDLGFFGRGIMDKSFEDATFALEKGQVSEIVRSGFGFHIIKLTDIEPRKIKPFEEVREILEQEYRNTEADGQFFELVEQLETAAFENPDTLSVAAEVLDMEVVESELFSRTKGEGIADNPKIRTAAFQSDVLENRNNSELIEVTTNDVVVLRVKQHKPSTTKPLEEVREQITEILRKNQGKDKAKSSGEAFLAQMREGGDPTELATGLDLEWKRPGFIGRNDDSIDRSLVRVVFETARPTEEQPSVGTFQLPSGDYAVYSVYEVRDGDPASLSDEDKTVLKDTQIRVGGQAEFGAMIEMWKQSADVVLFPEQL